MDVKIESNVEEKSSETTMAASEEQEPLGSLTLTDVPELKGQQLRLSARVFKKMKLDTAPLVVPEKNEKKEIIKQDKKKCLRQLWSSDEKALFFEALNEYGKDFESIQLYISNKFRKKGLPDQYMKTKDQIRHLYYRTWTKISKYLKFADVIKKPTQELYALINYGELRKKVGSVHEKYLLKLNRLIYKGSIVLSLKGKKIRLKTPFCRALRKLNQLDEKYEEIKLPTRLTVELRPKDMTSFLRVQSTAQNPRLQTYMPLQKRLSSLIECLSKKWQSVEAEMYDKALICNNPVVNTCLPSEEEIKVTKEKLNSLLRLTPPLNCKIEVPSISLGEYFTRQNICFNSHEARLGLSSYNSFSNYTACKLLNKGSKKGHRNRTDSVSDKLEKSQKSSSHNEDEICDTVETEPAGESIKLSIKEEANPVTSSIKENVKEGGHKEEGVGKTPGVSGKLNLEEIRLEEIKQQEESKNRFIVNATAELEKQERIMAIRKGWTAQDCESITLGELYLMFGQNSKLILEYTWDPPNITQPDPEVKDIKTEIIDDILNITSPLTPSPNLDLGESLSKLLSIAKLHYRKNMIKCPCGHVCGAKNNAQLKRDVETKIRKILSDIDKCPDENEEKINNEGHVYDSRNGARFATPSVYLPSKIPITPYFRTNDVHLASQIASIQRLTPRYCNRRGRRPRSKQVVVERQLPLLPNNVESGHQIVRMSIISKEDPAPSPSATATETSADKPSNSKSFVSQETSTGNFIAQPDEVLNETLQSVMIDIEPSSPSRILKEDEHWINSEVGDYSLSSLLGHLESPVKSDSNTINEYSRLSQDVDAQLRSLMTQNSVDFSANFADLAAEVAKDTKCELG
ncbi:unnamed protein product [Phyllotreta striolata]|uniref:SANT domain-containing protein n=1 Tax=Phyllotreta striolata TaxID=444603 RepID=A0A9N9TTI8_PHYSR|nr:unnamed protein product [Phyllotreta striolata]